MSLSKEFKGEQDLFNYCKYVAASMLLYMQQEVKSIFKSCTDPQEYKVYNKHV